MILIFILGMMIGASIGMIVVALLTGSRERRYWEEKLKGGIGR
jgi:hypothetical protein